MITHGAAPGGPGIRCYIPAAMKRADKAERIRVILDELYPEPPIPLDHTDPFTLLVAVLLSAQTTDARVNLVTPGLFKAAPDPLALSKLSVEEIREHIKTCGLAPAKAKALAGLSRMLMEHHDGQVPESFEALEALPGVGHKTASVVMAQAFGNPAFPVDTHIHRLAARWGLSNGSTVERTERDLKALYADRHWNKLHLQIIYFGREHCPALHHDLSTCPICGWAASKKRIADEAKKQQAARAARAKKAAAKKKAAPKKKAAGKKSPTKPRSRTRAQTATR